MGGCGLRSTAEASPRAPPLASVPLRRLQSSAEMLSAMI
jgi:hypothetical protein